MPTTPIWLRKHAETEQAKLWTTRSNEKIADDYDLKFNKELQTDKSTKQTTVVNSEIGDTIISKGQLYTNEIEQELNKIEAEWTAKFKLNEPETKQSRSKVNKHNIFKRTQVNESQQHFHETYADDVNNNNNKTEEADQVGSKLEVNRKFLETTQIHTKPKELFHLAQIFKINAETTLNTEENEDESVTLHIPDESAMSQLIFIEYLIERLRQIITPKSKDYLREKKPGEKSTVQMEREREEKLKHYEQYITKKNVWFSDLMSDSKPVNKTSTSFATQIKRKEEDPDDNGEAEMQAKLDYLSLTQETEYSLALTEAKSQEEDELNPETKKPLPDFKKLQEEAIIQQLQIKEFFQPCTSVKKIQFREDLVALEEGEEEKGEQSQDRSLIINNKETNEEIVRVLPTVDSLSQIEIRRKIFYEKLIK